MFSLNIGALRAWRSQKISLGILKGKLFFLTQNMFSWQYSSLHILVLTVGGKNETPIQKKRCLNHYFYFGVHPSFPVYPSVQRLPPSSLRRCLKTRPPVFGDVVPGLTRKNCLVFLKFLHHISSVLGHFWLRGTAFWSGKLQNHQEAHSLFSIPPPFFFTPKALIF